MLQGVYLGEVRVADVGSAHGFKFLPRIGYYIALMLEGKLPTEYADKWRWRPGQERKWHDSDTEWTLVGKDLKDAEGLEGSARHGIMANTWGN